MVSLLTEVTSEQYTNDGQYHCAALSKVIRHVIKILDRGFMLQSLGSSGLHLRVYTDAAFDSKMGVSQLGYAIDLTDSEMNESLLP